MGGEEVPSARRDELQEPLLQDPVAPARARIVQELTVDPIGVQMHLFSCNKKKKKIKKTSKIAPPKGKHHCWALLLIPSSILHRSRRASCGHLVEEVLPDGGGLGGQVVVVGPPAEFG